MDKFVRKLPKFDTKPVCLNTNFPVSNTYDIGNFAPICINCPKELCYNLLEKHEKVQPGFKVYSQTVKQDETLDLRSLTYDTVMRYDWLVYSSAAEGLFCLDCSAMAKSTTCEKAIKAYMNHYDPVFLVKKPLQNFKKITGTSDNKLLSHHTSAFHDANALKARDFRTTQRNLVCQ